MPRPTTTLITDIAALERLAPEWHALLARSGGDEPSQSPLWLLAWWRVFGGHGGRRLRTIAVWEGERLIGLAPLLARWHYYRPAIPFRRLEVLGSGEPEADEICSQYLGVCAERGEEQAVARAIAVALGSRAVGAWDELVIPAMSGETNMPLAEELTRAGLTVTWAKEGAAAYIPLPRTFDEYLGRLSSSSRYEVRRSIRDFEQWAGHSATLETATNGAELRVGLGILRDLHTQRWQSEGKSGAYSSEKFSRFHEMVTPALLDRSALDLIWLRGRGEPVAAVYNIVWGNKLYGYQMGRSVRVPQHVRPGSVILALSIRKSIEEGLREYDLLGGNSTYKARLTLATRPMMRLRASRSPYIEKARIAAETGIRMASEWARPYLERARGRAAQTPQP